MHTNIFAFVDGKVSKLHVTSSFNAVLKVLVIDVRLGRDFGVYAGLKLYFNLSQIKANESK